MAYEGYNVRIVKNWSHSGGSGSFLASAIQLFDNNGERTWGFEEGRVEIFRVHWGFWFLIPREKKVALQNEGYQTFAYLDYKRWPWRKGDGGKLIFIVPGPIITGSQVPETHEYDYVVHAAH